MGRKKKVIETNEDNKKLELRNINVDDFFNKRKELSIQDTLSHSINSTENNYSLDVNSDESIHNTSLSDVNNNTLIQSHDTQRSTNKLVNNNSNKITYFMDARKHKIKSWLNILCEDGNPLPIFTSKPCKWCKNTFSTGVLGLPIQYIPHTKHDISGSQGQDIFITESFYCSFPCIKSYIIEYYSQKYKNSLTLLSLMYFKIYNEVANIPCAPHWTQLEMYGGHLTIDEFRSSFGRLLYEETNNIRKPFMYSSGTYYEERMVKNI